MFFLFLRRNRPAGGRDTIAKFLTYENWVGAGLMQIKAVKEKYIF